MLLVESEPSAAMMMGLSALLILGNKAISVGMGRVRMIAQIVKV